MELRYINKISNIYVCVYVCTCVYMCVCIKVLLFYFFLKWLLANFKLHMWLALHFHWTTLIWRLPHSLPYLVTVLTGSLTYPAWPLGLLCSFPPQSFPHPVLHPGMLSLVPPGTYFSPFWCPGVTSSGRPSLIHNTPPTG